jgi:hypothetical protein
MTWKVQGNKRYITCRSLHLLALEMLPKVERCNLQIGGASETRGWKGMKDEPD